MTLPERILCDKCGHDMILENQSRFKNAILFISCCRVCGWKHKELRCIQDDPPIPEAAKAMHTSSDDLIMGDDYKKKVEFLEKAAKVINDNEDDYDENDAFIKGLNVLEHHNTTIAEPWEPLQNDTKEKEKESFGEKFLDYDIMSKQQYLDKIKEALKGEDPWKKQYDIMWEQQYNKVKMSNTTIAEPWINPLANKSKKVEPEPEPSENACPQCDTEMKQIDEIKGTEYKYVIWECPDCGHTVNKKEQSKKAKRKVVPGIGKRKVKFRDD